MGAWQIVNQSYPTSSRYLSLSLPLSPSPSPPLSLPPSFSLSPLPSLSPSVCLPLQTPRVIPCVCHAPADVRIITPRARAVATNGVASSGYGQQGYTSHNQHYNTIGHSRSRAASTTSNSSSARSGGGSSTTPRGGSSNYLAVPGVGGPLARSSSAADVSSTSSMPAGEIRRCTTPKPRATILSAARMAKGSANSLRKDETLLPLLLNTTMILLLTSLTHTHGLSYHKARSEK